MENKQVIGDVTDSSLQNINNNTQTDYNVKIDMQTKKTVWDNSYGLILFISILSLSFSLASLITTTFIEMESNLEMISQSLIITFIGILATFVVVSNYIQVNEIKKEFKENIGTNRTTIENLKSELNEIKSELDKKVDGKNIEETINKLKSELTLKINKISWELGIIHSCPTWIGTKYKDDYISIYKIELSSSTKLV